MCVLWCVPAEKSSKILNKTRKGIKKSVYVPLLSMSLSTCLSALGGPKGKRINLTIQQTQPSYYTFQKITLISIGKERESNFEAY